MKQKYVIRIKDKALFLNAKVDDPKKVQICADLVPNPHPPWECAVVVIVSRVEVLRE